MDRGMPSSNERAGGRGRDDLADVSVVFFDLDALLDRAPGRPPRVRPSARRLLRRAARAGILANLPRAFGRPELLLTLTALGVDGLIDDALVVDAAVLPTPLPDRRAFAAAAAMAETAPAGCRFVTTNLAFRIAADRAGFGTGRRTGTAPVQGAVPPDALLDIGQLAGPEPLRLIDEDTGPTFILRGRVVTMTRRGVIANGRVAVRRGSIVAVLEPGEPLPPTLAERPVIETDGTIYPGLIDLHNHYVYDVAPLWVVPRRFEDRSHWSSVASKQTGVSLPVKLLASFPATAKAIARFVEAKALLGGTTTGQGMKTQVEGGFGLFRGAMRNVEAADDPRLPNSATLVPTLGRRAEDFEAFRKALDKRARLGGSYFYHLAEGTAPLTLRTYTDLRDNQLLRPPLAGIHCLALEPGDLRAMGAAGAKVVWSPFSNLLLYGRTLDVRVLAASHVRFAIGADWAPSGSKNLLEELKVARHVVGEQGASLSSRRLVSAVTADAAMVAGWGDRLGRIRTRTFADLLVIGGTDGDPYDHLIDATERDVRLVTVHGVPRYGDADLMDELRADASTGGTGPDSLEPWTAGGVRKAFQLGSPASAIGGLTLAAAQDELRRALSDLPALQVRASAEQDRLMDAGVPSTGAFSLVLDNESPADTAMDVGGPMFDTGLDPVAAPVTLPPSLELDELEVGGGTYWTRIADQPNVRRGLKEMLRHAYDAP